MLTMTHCNTEGPFWRSLIVTTSQGNDSVSKICRAEFAVCNLGQSQGDAACKLPHLGGLLLSVLSNCIWLFSQSVMSDSATPWTVACQAPLSVRFSRQEYWSGSPFPSPGDLLDPGIQLRSPTLQADFFIFIVWAIREEMAICYSTSQVKRDQLSKPSAGWAGFFFQHAITRYSSMN